MQVIEKLRNGLSFGVSTTKTIRIRILCAGSWEHTRLSRRSAMTLPFFVLDRGKVSSSHSIHRAGAPRAMSACLVLQLRPTSHQLSKQCKCLHRHGLHTTYSFVVQWMGLSLCSSLFPTGVQWRSLSAYSSSKELTGAGPVSVHLVRIY